MTQTPAIAMDKGLPRDPRTGGWREFGGLPK
jgi:hypothetical protein